MSTKTTTCADCKKTVLWETFNGMRIYKRREGRKEYRTRCGCGEVTRDGRGRKARGEGR